MYNDMMRQILQRAGQGATPQLPVGMAPPQQPLPMPTMGNHMMPPATGPYQQQAQGLLANPQPVGPYGAQAAQLAGLLGGGGQVPPLPVMRQPYTPGLFMPGFQPGINTPHPGGGGKPPYHMRQV